MSDLRKMYALQRKANYSNKKLEFEIDVITEDHSKAEWSLEDWRKYYKDEKAKGNQVIVLYGEGSKFDDWQQE